MNHSRSNVLKFCVQSVLIVLFLFLNISQVFATTLANGISAENVIGQPTFTATSSSSLESSWNLSQGMVYDMENSRLFVVDTTNDRVFSFNISSGITDGMNASHVLGAANLLLSGSNTVTQNSFSRPHGLAYDSGNNLLFSVDNGGNRILVFDVTAISNGENALYVLGQTDFTSGTMGTTQSTFNQPSKVAVDEANERLFVSDSANNRVMVFDYSAGITNGMNASYVLGQADFVTNSGSSTTQSSLQSPGGIYYDTTGNRLFVSNTGAGRVSVFDVTAISNGENATYVIGAEDFSAPSGATDQDSFNFLGNITLDETNGRLFVSDTSNNRVMVFDISNGITNGMDASFVIGQANFTSSGANYGGALVSDGRGGFRANPSQSGFTAPDDLSYDSVNERLFVSDSANNRVMMFDLTPTATNTGKGYAHPPQCTAQFTPSTITKGQPTTLSWNVIFPGKQSSYYVKIPTLGIFGQNTTDVTLTPSHTVTYQLASTNLYGANFCDAKITVLDTDGTEIVSTQNSYLTANSIKSPFGSMIVDFFKRLFGKK